MNASRPARARPRHAPWIALAGLLVLASLVVVSAIAAAFGDATSSPSRDGSRVQVLRAAGPVDPGGQADGRPGRPGPHVEALASPDAAPGSRDEGSEARSRRRGRLGEADGVLPGGTTVFDDELPGIGKLAPDLLAALRQAAADAAHDDAELVIESGWRSPTYQTQLLREAVSTYGSAADAARWVATPDTSSHVSGDAVDIGSFAATAWLSKHGAAYGLCPVYRNEPWHYELRPSAIDRGCPRLFADATRDPRMHQ